MNISVRRTALQCWHCTDTQQFSSAKSSSTKEAEQNREVKVEVEKGRMIAKYGACFSMLGFSRLLHKY